jgi:hypothetical protein
VRILVAIATATLCACGASEVVLAPIDPPVDTYAAVAASGRSALGIKLAVDDLEDNTKRLRPTLVGSALTGMANTGADVLATESGTTIVTNALRKAAGGVGFELTDREQADLIATGSVTHLWVSEQATKSGQYAEADVAFSVTFSSRTGTQLWANAIEGRATSGLTMIDVTQDDGKTLEHALVDALQRIFSAQSFWDAVAAWRGSAANPAVSAQ